MLFICHLQLSRSLYLSFSHSIFTFSPSPRKFPLVFSIFQFTLQHFLCKTECIVMVRPIINVFLGAVSVCVSVCVCVVSLPVNRNSVNSPPPSPAFPLQIPFRISNCFHTPDSQMSNKFCYIMQILGEENMHNILTKLFSLCVCVCV